MSNKARGFPFINRKSFGKSLDKDVLTSYRDIKNDKMSKQFIRTKPPVPFSSTFLRSKGLEQSCQSLKELSQGQSYSSSLKSLKMKWKHNDVGLRQTEDSVRQFNKKQSISIQDFKQIKTLGKGKHGTVYLAKHKRTNFLGALKVFQKEDFEGNTRAERDKLQQLLIQQLKIQSFVNHSSILKVYSIFSDESCLYLFMELGTDGQLFDVFQKKKQLRQETVSFVTRSLLEGLKHLHENNIIHRDLKSENVVLIHGFPKICDFGQSSVCNKSLGELRETLCGTPLYLSPEILMGQKYDQKIDIWALGAMAYELFTGNNPFNVKHKEQLNKVITEEFKMTQGSIQLRNFLIYCMKKVPRERPSAEKLLKHPFIKKWSQLQTSQQLCS